MAVKKSLKSLILTDSAGKARTLKKFLGRSYTVFSTEGFVKDLPKSRIGIDENYLPDYITVRGKGTLFAELRKETFPPRNRIIAGLSRGVIVVEAGEKSGALITCDYAGDYGRDVFAVPSDIYSPKGQGVNELIRDQACLVRNVDDVLNGSSWYKNSSDATKKEIPAVSDHKETVQLEGVEKKIFDAIPSGNFISVDEILMEVEDVSSDEISSVLIKLELQNYIVEEDGGYTRS